MIWAIVVFWIFLFFSPLPAEAIKEFNNSHHILYQIGENGSAQVEQHITLTNNITNIYPTEYLFETSQSVENISAWDDQGNILAEIKKREKNTQIKLKFNQKAVGKGKETKFTIRYRLAQVATKRGQVWEIIIPQVVNYNQIDSLVVELRVPTSFGKLAYSSVKIKKMETQGNTIKLVLDSPSLQNQTAILSFGHFQSFDFSLTYRLEEVASETRRVTLAIPPQTNYQEIVLDQITPLPEKVKSDKNGNWLAEYIIPPQKTLTVLILGQARVFATPQPSAHYNQEKYLSFFLKEDQYWEISAPQITSLAQRLRTAKAIYQFVVSHLEYDYEILQKEKNPRRKGALAALTLNKKAVCTEFTDLFIALARAAGIPAREIEGFAYTNNPKLKPLSLSKDVLHAWPEYWHAQKKEWIQVDPTWGRTTGGVDYFENFDFNHVAFVIHGDRSDFPSPPNSKIAVSFSTQKKEGLSASQLLERVTAKFQRQHQEGKIILKNTTLSPIEKIKVNNQIIPLLPPLGETTISVATPPWWQQFIFNPQIPLSLALSQPEISRTIFVSPLSSQEAEFRKTIFWIGTGILLILTGIVVVKIITKVAKRRQVC